MKPVRWMPALACALGLSTGAAAQVSNGHGNPGTGLAPAPVYNGGTSDRAELPPGTTLRGSFVYVYSFLDLRTDLLGDELMDALQQQLGSRLADAEVGNKVLPSKQNPAMRFEFEADGSKRVATATSIVANAADEAATKAQFRLLVFPSKVSESIYPPWQYYDIDWALFDVRPGRKIWALTTHDKHSAIGFTGPSGRARSTLKRVFESLKGVGLI